MEIYTGKNLLAEADSATYTLMFIISTHQVRDVENMLDQMMVIDQGQIAP